MIHAYFTAILFENSRFYKSSIFNRKFKFKIGFIISSPENNSLDTDDLSDFPTLGAAQT